ncbi:MAG: tetratricopeptide repeat protein [Gemmatimonadota bacterium]
MSEIRSYQRFFAELKRRHVFRVAAVYGATAFVVLQVAELLQEALELPAMFLKVTMVFGILGFPIAVVLAWAFENTPGGVVRTEPASSEEIESIVAQPASRRWPSGLLALVGIGALAIATWLTFVREPSFPVEIAAGDEQVVVAREAAALRPSVAVLPFEDMSAGGDQAYFADGMAEEILNVLAKVPQLQVAARTSSFSYRGSSKDVREIGRELGVGAVLEGSVRQDGDRVRITAQLIDTESGFHLWSDTYTRELTGVFALQDEISHAIVAALQVSLVGDDMQTLVKESTDNPAAYDEFLRGRYEWNRRGREGMNAALDHFQRAVDIDPGFAPAWAGLSHTLGLIFIYDSDRTWEQDLVPARAAAQRALELDPELPEAYTGLAHSTIDTRESEAALRRAIELNPGYAAAHQWLGELLSEQGRHEEALEEGRLAIQLDPMSLAGNLDLGRDLMRARKYDEAVAQLRRTLELDPGLEIAYASLADTYIWQRRWDDAEAVLGEHEAWVGPRDESYEAEIATGRAADAAGGAVALPATYAERCANRALEPGGTEYPTAAACAYLYAIALNRDSTLAWLERVEWSPFETTIYQFSLTIDPAWDFLRGEPRFEAARRAQSALYGIVDP